MLFHIFLLLNLISTSHSADDSNILIKLKKDNSVNIRGPIQKELTNKFFHDLKNFDGDILNVFINSPGGSVMEGMKIIDHFKTLSTKNVEINCIADFAASMAFVIFQSCKNRYVLTSSILMQHQMSLSLDGSFENLKNYLKMTNDINEHLIKEQSNRIGLASEDFKNKIANDWWISGISTIDNNLADNYCNLICSTDLYKMDEKTKIENFFGDFEITYNRCPLIRNPLKIKFNNNISNEIKKEFIEKYYTESYTSGKLQIKSWY